MKAAPLLLPVALATGCAGPGAGGGSDPFLVRVGHDGQGCVVEAAGRHVSLDMFDAIARAEARPGRAAAVVVADPQSTPYRCIGGAIYQLQRAGFRDIGSDALAEPSR